MNLVLNNPESQIINETEVIQPSRKNFIEANTTEVSLRHLKDECTIPVFSRDNQSTVSHYEFIKYTEDVITDVL